MWRTAISADLVRGPNLWDDVEEDVAQEASGHPIAPHAVVASDPGVAVLLATTGFGAPPSGCGSHNR